MLRNKYITNNGREFTLPSVTIPNQALSISEILNRYAVGRDVPFCPGGLYDQSDAFEEDPLRDPSLDLVDKEAAAVRIAEMIENSKNSQPTDNQVENVEEKSEENKSSENE